MMQGIGAEVSQKIRSAIKAKLMELGAYVDEELPDYVMVMVANKRSQSQMEDDLQLFLGSSTVVFTTWLHQVLQKLQEVTVASLDVKKEGSSSSKRKSSDSDLSKKKKKSKQSTTEVSSKKHDKRHEKTESSKSDSSNKHEKIESSKSDSVNNEEQRSVSHEQDKRSSSKTHSSPPRKHESKEESVSVSKQNENHGDNDKSQEDCVDINISSCKTEKQNLPSKEKSSEDSANIPEDNKPSDSLQSDEKERRERSPSQGDDDDFINIKADLDGEDLIGSDLIEETNPKTPVENKKHSSDSQINITISEENADEKQISDQNTTRKSAEKVLDARELLNRKKAARLADIEDSRPIPVISSNRRSRGISPCHKDHRYSFDDRPSRRVISTKPDRPLYHKSHNYQDERNAKRFLSEDNSSTSRGLKSTNVRRRDSDNDVLVKKPVILDRSRYNKDERSGRTHYSKVISISQTLRVEREVTRGRKVIEEDRITSGGLSRTVSRQQKSDDEDVDTTVSSVVKVTPRPKRPLSQQANHTLILKAVADANKSLANAPPRPDITQQKKRGRPESLFIRTLKDMIRPEKIAVSISNNTIQHTGQSNKTEVDINISEECDDEIIGMSVDDSSQGSSTYNMYKRGVSDQGEGVNNELITSVQKWLKGVNEADSDRLDNENRVVNNRLQNTDLQKADHTQTKETDEGPQFVVTLNGLDPSMFLSEQEEYEVDLLQWENVTENQENKEILQHRQIENETDRVLTPPLSPPAKKKRCSSPIIIVSKGSSHKSTEDLVEGGKTKILERCKYWPSCRSGDNCNYHHPSVACKMFPACKFGDHCLFIHPQCKFNTACTRRDCAYSHTHSSVLTPIQPSAISKGKCGNSSNIPFCRFYPNCTNINCQFYHPKPCRFGHYCTKKDCTFDHSGQMPSVDKLKWTRPQT